MIYMGDQEIMPLLPALDQAVMVEVAIVQDLPMVQVMEAQVPLTDLEVTAARQVLGTDLQDLPMVQAIIRIMIINHPDLFLAV